MCKRGVMPVLGPESRMFNRSSNPYCILDFLSALCPGMARGGFTLIELLVVVLIIGILSAVALPQYTRAVQKARMTEAITTVRFLRDQQRLYYLANSSYAKSFDDLGADGFEGTGDMVKKDFSYGIRGYYGGSVQALYRKSPQIWIEAYGNDDRIVCTAARTNAVGNAFCGAYGPQEECLDGATWWSYRIQ